MPGLLTGHCFFAVRLLLSLSLVKHRTKLLRNYCSSVGLWRAVTVPPSPSLLLRSLDPPEAWKLQCLWCFLHYNNTLFSQVLFVDGCLTLPFPLQKYIQQQGGSCVCEGNVEEWCSIEVFWCSKTCLWLFGGFWGVCFKEQYISLLCCVPTIHDGL